MNGIGEPEALKENLQGYFSRRINEKDLYKKGYPDVIGIEMRKAYEEGRVRNAYEFEEVLKDVLCSCKR